MGSAFDWTKIKAEYVSLLLKGGDIKPSYFTNKYGMKYQTLMAKKKQQKWDKTLAAERRSLEAKTNSKVKNALSTSNAEDILDEIKVRKRIMQRANEIIEPVLKELKKKLGNQKDMKKLGIPTLVSIADTLTKVEIKAAGLPDKLDITSKNLSLNVGADTDHLSPAENRKMVRDAEDLANSLQTLLTEFETIDVEPTKPKKQGVQKLLKGKGNNKS